MIEKPTAYPAIYASSVLAGAKISIDLVDNANSRFLRVTHIGRNNGIRNLTIDIYFDIPVSPLEIFDRTGLRLVASIDKQNVSQATWNISNLQQNFSVELHVPRIDGKQFSFEVTSKEASEPYTLEK